MSDRTDREKATVVEDCCRALNERSRMKHAVRLLLRDRGIPDPDIEQAIADICGKGADFTLLQSLIAHNR